MNDVYALDYHKTKKKLGRMYPSLRGLVWFEDCFHDTYIACVQRNKPKDLNLLTYFITVFRDLMRKYMRFTDKKNRYASAKNGLGVSNISYDVVIDDEEANCYQELQIALSYDMDDEGGLQDVFNTLSPDDRSLLQKLLAGMEGKEIAEIEGCSPQNISIKRRRLQERLKELI